MSGESASYAMPDDFREKHPWLFSGGNLSDEDMDAVVQLVWRCAIEHALTLRDA